MDIISAFAEGKTIQYKTVTGVWCDLTESEGLPMGTLEEEPNNFRIKPEPKYRPFANAEECWSEMKKHEPFGWVIKHNKNKMLIGEVDSFGGVILYNQRGSKFDFDEANRIFTFADGTPFGVKVEE